MHDYNFDTILSTDEKLLHIKLTKLGQILHVDKTGSVTHIHIISSNTIMHMWRHFRNETLTS